VEMYGFGLVTMGECIADKSGGLKCTSMGFGGSL